MIKNMWFADYGEATYFVLNAFENPLKLDSNKNGDRHLWDVYQVAPSCFVQVRSHVNGSVTIYLDPHDDELEELGLVNELPDKYQGITSDNADYFEQGNEDE